MPRPRGRPCRRSIIDWARASSQVATARAPASSPRCAPRSAAVRATVTADRALRLRSHVHRARAPLSLCSLRRQGPVRSTIQAPSTTIFSWAPSCAQLLPVARPAKMQLPVPAVRLATPVVELAAARLAALVAPRAAVQATNSVAMKAAAVRPVVIRRCPVAAARVPIPSGRVDRSALAQRRRRGAHGDLPRARLLA